MMSHRTSMELQPWLILMKLLTALPNIYSVKLSWVREGRANILIGLNEFGVGGVPARASCKNFNRPLMKRANLQ